MVRSDERLKRILVFQKTKKRELQRPVSFYEAVALWFSEANNRKKERVLSTSLLRKH